MDDVRGSPSRGCRRAVLNKKGILMKKYFEYLEELRCSGVTNMFGARPYLQKKFPELSDDPERARKILLAWFDSFRAEGGKDE